MYMYIYVYTYIYIYIYMFPKPPRSRLPGGLLRRRSEAFPLTRRPLRVQPPRMIGARRAQCPSPHGGAESRARAWAPAVGMTHLGVLYFGRRACYICLRSGWGSDGNVYNALRG